MSAAENTPTPTSPASGARASEPTVSRSEVRGRVWQQLPLLLGLVVLWAVLWGQFSWLNVLTGFLVAILVTRVLYLPPADISGRLNLWYSFVFLAYFIADVTLASFTVAFQALNPRPIPTSSVIAVQLRTRSDFVMTLDAIAMSLVPGSIVIEVDRERAILYFHTFGTTTAADVEKMRAHVLVVEARIVRAIGSSDDLARINETEATR
ncbi:Na+/H+ antiporter subunit E [Salinibacterium sp. UTAS2018]|uniref:Na+/H+ antiporter subunit E n=1 Tax=Salinibacterium sp. UTAS2018 TaxID=2508880 RepID=UPI0010096E2C|nr:Na+/H+ antiporter subunit E [Salinibacterium sp. UTAS2018]QAV70147.1 Na+/H+ antiporter subunit E [Salinibacterium sp. UTAS2018]